MKKFLIAFMSLSLSMAGTFGLTVSFAALNRLEKEFVARAQSRKRARARIRSSRKRTTNSSSSGCTLGRKDKSQLNPMVSARAIESLIVRTRGKGMLPIIVGLCVEFVPEGKLTSPEAIKAQRQAIAEAQDKLLGSLSAYNVTSVKRYEFIPFIAMQVDSAALMFLKTSSQVASIEEDTQVPPMN